MKGVCAMGVKKGQESIATILNNLEKLGVHLKKYRTGAYPAFFLQLHTTLRIQDILDMQLSDIYFFDEGKIRLLPDIVYTSQKVNIDDKGRIELAWYAMQRMAVCEAKEDVLDDWLCVNKQGNQLLMQAYRKLLDRSCGELGFKINYNAGYLHSLYGYLEIAFGKKTIDEIAKEYEVSRYYLLNRIFRGRDIQYHENIIQQVANSNAEEVEGCQAEFIVN